MCIYSLVKIMPREKKKENSLKVKTIFSLRKLKIVFSALFLAFFSSMKNIH